MDHRDDITRREAAKLGGIALAAAASAPAILSGQGDNGFALGLIGTGRRGQLLLRHLNRLPGARCVALCDPHQPTLSKAREMSLHAPRPHQDYREVLSRKEVEAVLVATPPHTHLDIVRAALQAGKHVFCEPLLVFKPEEVHALRALVSEHSNLVLQVGLERRYSEFYQTAKQMVSKGLLGEVTDIYAQWHTNEGWTPNPGEPRERNWKFYREFSCGLTSELAAPQIDVANWMFADRPEHMVGDGALTWKRDGRDVFDNISFIARYPGGQKLIYSSITGNQHLSMFGAQRAGAGECIMGTEGTIEITLGTGDEATFGLWFYEPGPQKVMNAEDRKQMAQIAGATVGVRGRSTRGTPILLARDQLSGSEAFFDKEMKYMRRWLYAKNIMVPQEQRSAMEAQLTGFVDACRGGRSPRADVEVGLENASTVMLAQLAMEEGRRVQFSEIEKLGQKQQR